MANFEDYDCMEMNRRSFCRLTLVGALTASLPALAESAKAPLQAVYASLPGEVELSIKNNGRDAIELLTLSGYAETVKLEAKQGSNDWQVLTWKDKPQYSEFERMSRLGPRPRWRSLAPGSTTSFGMFATLQDWKEVELRLTITTRDSSVTLPSQRVSLSP